MLTCCCDFYDVRTYIHTCHDMTYTSKGCCKNDQTISNGSGGRHLCEVGADESAPRCL